MKISYTKHAKEKISIYKIDLSEIEQVISNNPPVYFNTRDNTFIIIGKITLRIGVRPVVIAISTGVTSERVVTVYPCTEIEKEIERKSRQKRWLKID